MRPWPFHETDDFSSLLTKPYLLFIQTLPSFPRDFAKQYWILLCCSQTFLINKKHSKSQNTGFSFCFSQTFLTTENTRSLKRYGDCQLWLLYELDICCAVCFRSGQALFIKQMNPLVYSPLINSPILISFRQFKDSQGTLQNKTRFSYRFFILSQHRKTRQV
jgi:hypothetical protein